MSTPIGPYSPGRRAGDFVILSGQLGMVPGAATPTLVEGGAAAELRQGLENAKALLAEHGATMNDVVKGTLFLMDLDADFAACNEVWVTFFDAPRPTRSTIQVAKLPMGARAEAELWAYAPEH
jgi:2-iminobutanoate/2-iminopropanoate deaminase